MRTRGLNRAGLNRAGVAACAGLALLATGSAGPAFAADGSTPGTQPRSPRSQETKPVPEPVRDVTAPPRPTLGEAITEAGGTVRLDVQAEGGSVLVVREGGQIVATTSAAGSTQPLSWRTTSGPHTYLVVASDAAGNVSEPASLDLQVDATPPAARSFRLTPGKARDSRSRWSVVTEPGTAWTLLVDGNMVADGTAEGRTLSDEIDLADGTHQVRLELRDEVGNLRVASGSLDVDVPALWVAAKAVSDAGDTEQIFKVSAPPMTRGFLRILGGGSEHFDLTSGRAEVAIEVPEGSYDAPVVVVADALNRKGTVSLKPFEVDLTPPALTVDTVAGSADRGRLDATITAGEGDSVAWRIVDAHDFAVMSGEFVADGTAQRLQREVAQGSYRLEVTATDAHGNVTARTLETTVAARPIVNPDAVPAIAIAVVLWVLFGIVYYLRRRGVGVGTVLARLRPKLRGPGTKRAHAAAEQARVAGEYAVQLAAFETENAAWQERKDALSRLLTLAGGGRVEAPEVDVELAAGERVLCVVPASLLEMQVAQGTEVLARTGEGRLVVTDARICYVGATTRDWPLAELHQLRHLGSDRTLMTVEGDDTVAGVAYDDAEVVRLYLELAMARHNGSTRSVRIMLEQGLRGHELRRPQPPTPVGVEAATAGLAVPAPATVQPGQPGNVIPTMVEQAVGTDRELALLDH